MSEQCRTCRLWAAGQGGATGLCQATDRSAVRRSFIPGLLLRLASGDVVSTAESACGEYMAVQQARRPVLTLVR